MRNLSNSFVKYNHFFFPKIYLQIILWWPSMESVSLWSNHIGKPKSLRKSQIKLHRMVCLSINCWPVRNSRNFNKTWTDNQTLVNGSKNETSDCWIYNTLITVLKFSMAIPRGKCIEMKAIRTFEHHMVELRRGFCSRVF